MFVRILKWLIALYSLGIVAWYFLARAPIASWWPLQLLQVFDAWLYLPVPLLALPVLLSRDWRTGAWLAIPFVIFGAQYGPLFLPRPAGDEGMTLRVMTANIHFENRDTAGLAEAIARERPDVLAVQELGMRISGPLGDRLRQDYPYQALHPRTDSRGMGIFSRYPMVEKVAPEMDRDECGCQQVELTVDGRQVSILSVHPDPPDIRAKREGPVIVPTGFSTGEQQRVVLAIRHQAAGAASPLLIMGDMNTTDHEQPYRILAEAYRDTYREAGWGLGFTFPAAHSVSRWALPAIRIDYIFHDDAWKARSARVIGLPGSDHNGVVADLALTERR